MDVLDDEYPVPIEYGGLVFSSCAHALEALPYLESCPALARALASEKSPERRRLLLERKRVETKRGATRWLRELNQKIEQFADAEPDPKWNHADTRHELLLRKFAQSHCKEKLELCMQSSEEVEEELKRVAKELASRALTPKGRVLYLLRLEIDPEAKEAEAKEEKMEQAPTRAKERLWAIRASSGREAAEAARAEMARLPESERPQRGARLGLQRVARALHKEFAEALADYSLCIYE